MTVSRRPGSRGLTFAHATGPTPCLAASIVTRSDSNIVARPAPPGGGNAP